MLLNILFAIIFIWLVAITYFYLRLISHYNKLIKNSDKGSLTKIIEDVFQKEADNSASIEKINKRCDAIEEKDVLHLQKIGLIRFNPFTETGGNQSFALSLLDGKNDGLVISSLHSRLQTRWYAKTVKNGVGEEHELSEEEKKVINQAIRKNK